MRSPGSCAPGRAYRIGVTSEEMADARNQTGRLRRRLSDIAAIDFFGATGRLAAEGSIADIEARLAEDTDMTKQSPAAARSAG